MCRSSYTVAWSPPTVARRLPSAAEVVLNASLWMGEAWLSLMTFRRDSPCKASTLKACSPPLELTSAAMPCNIDAVMAFI